jgi:hypothetical protein
VARLVTQRKKSLLNISQMTAGYSMTLRKFGRPHWR